MQGIHMERQLSMLEAENIQQTFGIDGHLQFTKDASGLTMASLRHAAGQLQLCLQGGHVFGWQIEGMAEPVLWLSPQARFAPGKSIRGGVPVCWPWFGPHGTDPGLPAHGFARTAPWQVKASEIDAQGRVFVSLCLQSEAGHAAMWPHAASLELTVLLGAELQMTLTTVNQGATPFVLGEALHTYFNINDIGRISVSGLEDESYWDTVGGVEKKVQRGTIRFMQETDRVYIDTSASCTIEDPEFRRRIHIAKQGSLSTVVWNPWTDKAARMGDLGQPDGWRRMVCVESANAWDNCLTLAPGEHHSLSVSYQVESF